MLKSEYRFSWFYLQLCIYSVFYLLPLPLFIWTNELAGLSLTFLVFSIIGFCGVYIVLKSAPVLIINSQQLIVQYLWNKKTIHRMEIKQVELITSAKWGFLIFNQLMEATTVETTAGEKLTFFEPFYSNMPAVRLLLGRLAELTEQEKDNSTVLDFTIPEQVEEEIPSTERGDEFAGNILRLFGRIAFYEFILFFIAVLIIVFNPNLNGLVIAILFVLTLLLIFSPQAHYFLISGNSLVVKNRLLPRFRKAYPLADIKDIKFENVPKRSTLLRITTRDFRSGTWAAGSLGRKNWKALQQRLEQLNIPVRNEAYL